MYESKQLRLTALDEKEMKEIYEGWFNDYDLQANTLSTGSITRPWSWDEFKTDLKDNQHRYAVRKAQDNAIIGVAVITLWELTHICTLMTYLKADERGKGYGTELSQLLTDIAFLECNAHKVRTSIYAFNPASYKRYEKLGYKLEACLREEVFRRGRYWDALDYGLLRTEWDAWQEHALVKPEVFGP